MRPRQTRIRKPARRDRLLMLLAVAQALLTLLGAASERSGLDSYLEVNTVKRHSPPSLNRKPAPAPPPEPVRRPARVARMLALAHRLDAAIE